jgi:hypothetical protein
MRSQRSALIFEGRTETICSLMSPAIPRVTEVMSVGFERIQPWGNRFSI